MLVHNAVLLADTVKEDRVNILKLGITARNLPLLDVEALARSECPLYQSKRFIRGLHESRFRVDFPVFHLALNSELQPFLLKQNGVGPFLDTGSLAESTFLRYVGQKIEVNGCLLYTSDAADD